MRETAKLLFIIIAVVLGVLCLLMVGDFFLANFAIAEEVNKLNIDIGYTHRWMLNAPSFSGLSFTQTWLSDKLGIPLLHGETNCGNWKIWNDYDSRNVDHVNGSGIRGGFIYDVYQAKSPIIAIGIGLDGSFSRFHGSVTSTPMIIIPDHSSLQQIGMKRESFQLNAYQVTLKGEMKVKPTKWLEVGVGAGPVFNFTDGYVGIKEGASRDDGLWSQQLWISSGVYKRRWVHTDISEINMGAMGYGVVRVNVSGPVWIFAGVRYDYMFGDINKTISTETFKTKLNTLEGTAGLTIKF